MLLSKTVRCTQLDAVTLFPSVLQTMSMILGEVPAPWEDPNTAPAIVESLGHLKKPIMGLLERDPEKRLSVEDFQRACRRMISNTTIGS